MSIAAAWRGERGLPNILPLRTTTVSAPMTREGPDLNRLAAARAFWSASRLTRRNGLSPLFRLSGTGVELILKGTRSPESSSFLLGEDEARTNEKFFNLKLRISGTSPHCPPIILTP